MRKIIFVLGLSLLALLSLSSNERELKRAKKKIVLKVLIEQDSMSLSSEVDSEIFRRFMEANPEIELQFERVSAAQYNRRIESIKRVAQMPDLLYLRSYKSGDAPSLAEKGLLQELTPLFKKSREHYIDEVFTGQRMGREGVYMLPRSINASHVLFVNRVMFEKYDITLPTTFSQLLEAAVEAKEKSGYPLITIANKSSWVMTVCLFSALVGRLGGAEWADKVVRGEASFQDEPFLEALHLVKKLYESGALGEDRGLNKEYADVGFEFAQEKAFMLIDGDWRSNLFEGVLSGREQLRIDFMVFPALEGEVKQPGVTTKVLEPGFGMRKGLSAKKVAAAWKFITFYAGPEAALIRLERQGSMPVYKMDPADLNLSPIKYKQYDFLKSTTTVPLLDMVFQRDIYNALNLGLQELALEKITPEELAEKLDRLMLLIH